MFLHRCFNFFSTDCFFFFHQFLLKGNKNYQSSNLKNKLPCVTQSNIKENYAHCKFKSALRLLLSMVRHPTKPYKVPSFWFNFASTCSSVSFWSASFYSLHRRINLLSSLATFHLKRNKIFSEDNCYFRNPLEKRWRMADTLITVPYQIDCCFRSSTALFLLSGHQSE